MLINLGTGQSINPLTIFSLEESVIFEEVSSVINDKQAITVNEIASVKVVSNGGVVLDVMHKTMVNIQDLFNKYLANLNIMLVQIGGHCINPINVFALEESTTEVTSSITNSINKEVTKTVTVPVVKIIGTAGAEIEIQGVSMEDVEIELFKASNVQPSPVESTFK